MVKVNFYKIFCCNVEIRLAVVEQNKFGESSSGGYYSSDDGFDQVGGNGGRTGQTQEIFKVRLFIKIGCWWG